MTANRKRLLAWLAAYLLVMVGVIGLMLQVRGRVLRTLDTPEARAEWQAWRESEPNRPGAGPVERRPPSSSEPPALVLLRDYFAVMLSAAVVFGSLLFAAIMIATRGALASTGQKSPLPSGEDAERRRGR